MDTSARQLEVWAIGRLLVNYNALEIALLNCVGIGTGDFGLALKQMFAETNMKRRIDSAEMLALPPYKGLGLGTDFEAGIAAIRHGLKIRDQYTHWTWWDDCSGQLAITDLRELAKQPLLGRDLSRLPVHHVSEALLRQQQAFFVYIDRSLAWLNYESRLRSGKASQGVLEKPDAIPEPELFHPGW